jgi:hypothetical protein
MMAYSYELHIQQIQLPVYIPFLVTDVTVFLN